MYMGKGVERKNTMKRKNTKRRIAKVAGHRIDRTAAEQYTAPEGTSVVSRAMERMTNWALQ